MASDDLSAFGAGLKALRVRRGLTQEKLAELSERDQTYLSGIENGRRNLGYRNLAKLAKALNVRTSELVAEGERSAHVRKATVRAKR